MRLLLSYVLYLVKTLRKFDAVSAFFNWITVFVIFFARVTRFGVAWREFEKCFVNDMLAKERLREIPPFSPFLRRATREC